MARRRVLLTLFSLLVLFTAGAVAATFFIRYSTRELGRVVKLQSIDHLRQELSANVRTVQSGLVSLHSPREAEQLLVRLEDLNRSAAVCQNCHHVPGITGRIREMTSLAESYDRALRLYLAAESEDARPHLGREAIEAGQTLLLFTETMEAGASASLEVLKSRTLRRADTLQDVLLVCLFGAVAVGAFLCLRLTDVLMEPLSDYKRQLLHYARNDPLTGLPNRKWIMERLSQVAEKAREQRGYLFAVMLLDLDRFKVVNNTLGHHAGDRILAEVGARLRRRVRAQDTPGRLAGDQFVVVLDGLETPEAATRAGETIRETLAEPYHEAGKEVTLTPSVGIVLSSTGFDAAGDLLRYAGIAMYRAKTGGNSVVTFDRNTDAMTIERLELEAGLRHAAERDELRLHLQPIVALDTGRVEGVETLLRWHHPHRGLLFPDAFVPLAEERDLILPLGRWALAESCRQMRALIDRLGEEAPSFVSVNLSGKQLQEPDLVDQVRSLLREHRLEGANLRLEITETALVKSTETVTRILGELRGMELGLCLDDFGTGYSSLGYLDQFPITTLKIDRSFVREMTVPGKTPEIVRTIVRLAKHLGIDVVAEGVESRQQLDQARALDCEYAQGYLISRPLELDDVAEMILEREDLESVA